MPRAVIRTRTDADIDACTLVLETTHRHDGYPTFWPRDPRRFVAPPYEVLAWVATVDRVVAGHVALHDAAQDPACATAAEATGLGADQLAAVGRLFVSPTHRGQNLGADLLAHATAAAHHAGKRPFLNVVQHLAPAVAMYERSGWQRLGSLRLEFSGDRSLSTFVYLGPAS